MSDPVLPGHEASDAPDVETSSDEYAARFSGTVGAWMLEVQARRVMELLGDLAPGSRVLDLGGGHGQLTAALLEAGFEVVVFASPGSSRSRLAPWLEHPRFSLEFGALRSLPYDEGAFDAALAFRLLTHMDRWQDQIRELCRVARRSVIVDFPTTRSLNVLADALFGLKRRVEGNTRPFNLFRPRDMRAAFRREGFRVVSLRPQFFFPMVLHRLLRSARASRSLELPASWVGLTRALGSPVILRADHVHGRRRS